MRRENDLALHDPHDAGASVGYQAFHSSGSQSGAGKKGSRSAGKSSKVIVATGLSKPLPAQVTPADRRETAPEIPSLKVTATEPALKPPKDGSKLPFVILGVAAALVPPFSPATARWTPRWTTR